MELLNAWESTLPATDGDPTAPASGAFKRVDVSLPHPGDPCAVTLCPEVLAEGEECYAVIEHPGNAVRGNWVCWRHIARENGAPRPVTTGGND